MYKTIWKFLHLFTVLSLFVKYSMLIQHFNNICKD